MKLTLFVDDKSSKLLFAEADKGFVDFLFTILSLPLGTVTKLLKQKDRNMVGSLGALYKSIEWLSNSYIQPDLSKEAVLCPNMTLPFYDNSAPLLKCVGAPVQLFRCGSCISVYVATKNTEKCPTCGQSMYSWVKYLNPSSAGYVKDVVTYMVMDNLDVKPMSNTISMSLLKTFNIKDVGDINEKTVDIGMAEGLKLLRASLISNTVLTDVFLSKTEVKEEEVVATSAMPPVAA